MLSPRSRRCVKKSPSPSRFVLLLLYTRVMLGVQAGSLDVTPGVCLCCHPLDFEYPCGNMALYHAPACARPLKKEDFKSEGPFGGTAVHQSVEQTSTNSSTEIHKLQIYVRRRTVHGIISENICQRKVRIMMVCEMNTQILQVPDSST